jgi:mRNA-degrading endonuclease RelE of RelBE toxin-antitoxin system
VKLRLTSFAKREMFRVHAYYEAKRAGLGDRFLDDIEVAFMLIKEHPYVWTQMAPSIWRIRLKRFKYGVLYRVYGDEIVIFVIGYLARRPAYWRRVMQRGEM